MHIEARMLRALSGASEADQAKGVALNRRSFLKLSAASGLALGVFPAVAGLAPKELKPFEQPNAFVQIDADGTVTVQVNRLDFGQGIQTALPMLVAEELDADWSRVRGALAPAGAAYHDPLFGMQMTGGSGSVAHSWQQYRELGARARAMLVAAAAEQWKVDVAQCSTANSFVMGPGGKKIGYGALAKAAASQPVPATVKLKEIKDFKLLGKPTGRLDARAKSTGKQNFGIDMRMPGMAVALVARPPVFGGKFKSLDTKGAEAVKGVRAIFPLPVDRGGVGVVVVADGYWQAKTARDALKIEWDSGALERVDSVKQLAQYRELAKQPGKLKFNDDTSKLASAPRKIDAEFTFPYLAHAPMEPLNCTLDFKGDSCEVWVGSQFQTVDHGAIAKTLGLAPEKVVLHTQMAGGGFGRRAVPTCDYIIEAANVAKGLHKAGRAMPVKVMWSREDDIHGGYYRPMHLHQASIGFDDAGKVAGWDHVIVGQSIVTGTPFEAFLVKDGIDGTAVEGMKEPYDIPMKLAVHHPVVNVPVLWWRSVGSTHTAFVMETLIDEIAVATKQDPVAYRMKMMDAKHARHRAALQLAVDQSGYGKTTLPAGQAWGVAVHESFNTVVAYVVQASVKDGVPKLHKVTAGVNCNFAVNPKTIEAQVQGAALMGLGMCLPGAAITLKDGVVEQSNFSDYSVARNTDMPQVSVHIVPSTEAPTGMGEPGLPPLAPAFANAVARLTGKRIRSLPFDLKA
jgi:isoquinoline 1-oxidoreductase beta subunit